MKNDRCKTAIAKQAATTDLIKQHLKQTMQWNNIYPYLLDNGYLAEQNEEEEAKSKRALVDSDTMTIAMLLYLRHDSGDEGYTVGSLAKILDGSSYNSRKAKERKIMRLLKTIAGYGVIDFFEDTHQGRRMCIRIEITDALVGFFENYFFK